MCPDIILKSAQTLYWKVPRHYTEIGLDIILKCVQTLYWKVPRHISPVFKGQALQSSSTAWPLKLGPTGCPETSVTNYRSTVRIIPDQRSSHTLKIAYMFLPPIVLYNTFVGTHLLPVRWTCPTHRHLSNTKAPIHGSSYNLYNSLLYPTYHISLSFTDPHFLLSFSSSNESTTISDFLLTVQFLYSQCIYIYIYIYIYILFLNLIIGLEWSRVFQEVKVPRLRDNAPERW